MIDVFIQKIVTFVSVIGVAEVSTALLAMTPIVGIRGAIPMALFVYEMDVYAAFFWSVLGEFFPVFFILLFLKSVSEWLSNNFSIFKKFFDFLFSKTRRDYSGKVEKYGLLALLLYTAIPLPFSGAWTASLVTFLFGFSRKKAMVVIFFGVLLSGINIILILQAGITIEEYSGPLTLLGFVAFASLIYFLYHRKRNKQNV